MKKLIVLLTLMLVSITLSFAQPGGGRAKNVIKTPKSGINTGSGNKSTLTKGSKRASSKSKKNDSSSGSSTSSQNSGSTPSRKSDHGKSAERATSAENVNKGSFTRNTKKKKVKKKNKKKGDGKAIKKTQLNDTYRKGKDELGKEAVYAKTDRAARRGVLRAEGIPTSSQPIKSIRKKDVIEYHYRVPKPGGGSNIKIVKKSTMDRNHDTPHWESR